MGLIGCMRASPFWVLTKSLVMLRQLKIVLAKSQVRHLLGRCWLSTLLWVDVQPSFSSLLSVIHVAFDSALMCSGHVEQSAWVSVDHLKVVAMGEVYIAYDKENDRISGAFRTFKDAETADPVLSHQPRYPRLQMG